MISYFEFTLIIFINSVRNIFFSLMTQQKKNGKCKTVVVKKGFYALLKG